MWPQRRDSEAGVKNYAAELEQSRQAAIERNRAAIKDAIMRSWPVEMAKSAYGAITLPGDVYAGRVNPMSDEAVGRAAEFAGLMTLGAGGVPAGRNEMRMGIKAYHGSPHDFDRFDMSKIGTGEGAQAYGHGLYFAGNEGVAKEYRNKLAPMVADTGYRNIDVELARVYGGAWDKFKAAHPNPSPGLRQAIAEIEAKGGPRLTQSPGRMYEVELNTTPDRLLDWDKPLSGQSDAVRRALEPMFGTKAADLPGQEIYKKAAGFDPMVNVARKSGQGASDILPMVFPDATQSQIQQALRAAASTRPGDDVASSMLRERGIPGIKYLDEGSRAAGDGSRNYVMFDDKLVKILRKYGVGTAAALPAAALAELGLSRKEAERTF